VRPVNLIPPEERRGENAPLRAGSMSYAIVGVLALALIGVVLMVTAGNNISESENELVALEARQAQAQAAAADLADYGQFAQLEQSRSETVSALAQTRFDWDRVLNELALVIPRRVTLEGVTGTVGSGVAVGGGTADTGNASASIAGPSLQITGCAKGQEGVARLLAALRDIDGVTRVGMQSSALGEQESSDSGAGGAATTDSASSDTPTTNCQARPSVARFQATVAFDAVPVPAAAAPEAAPAAAAPTGTTPAPAATDGGVSDAQAQEGEAAASANEQVSEGQAAAGALGADAQ
jgi:Tfp pilus assembly protein PilN